MAPRLEAVPAGQLKVWGDNTQGQLGLGHFGTFHPPADVLENVAAVALGHAHVLVLRKDGSVWAKGDNFAGQLGDGTRQGRTSFTRVPLPGAAGLKAVAVASGGVGCDSSYFLMEDGHLYGMGANGHGQLGQGSGPHALQPVFIAEGVTAVAAGMAHVLFLKSDGSVWACGFNAHGQFGDGTSRGADRPVRVGEGVGRLAARGDTSLFLKANGELWGSGYNGSGVLGGTHSGSLLTPVRVAEGVVSMALGYQNAMLVKQDGSLWMTGENRYGQFGNGILSGPVSEAPERVVPSGVVSAEVNDANGAFYLDQKGVLRAAGNNYRSLIGLPDSSQFYTSWEVVATGVSRISAASELYCFIKADGSLWTPGRPDAGGDGYALHVARPALLDIEVTDVATTSQASVYLRDGQLWVTGSVGSRLGGAESPNGLPTRLAWGSTPELSRVSRLFPSSGAPFLFFQTAEGELWAWGDNGEGRLSIGEKTSVPHLRKLGLGYRSAAASLSESVYLLNRDGVLLGQGANREGELGLGHTRPLDKPARIDREVVDMALGWAHGVFVKQDGSVWGAGTNAEYELGQGDNLRRTEPSRIGSDAVSVAAGPRSTAFIQRDGSLWVMGSNEQGALGLGNLDYARRPVRLAASVAQVVLLDGGILVRKRDGALWGAGRVLPSSGAGGGESNVLSLLGTSVAWIAGAGQHALLIQQPQDLSEAYENRLIALGHEERSAPSSDLNLPGRPGNASDPNPGEPAVQAPRRLGTWSAPAMESVDLKP